jgi:hypothetical protein
LLPNWAVLDWDFLMVSAGELAGVNIRETPRAWDGYGELMHAVVQGIGPERVVLLGVQTPDQMVGWPDADWILLDCSDGERTSRLKARGEPETVIRDAIDDAADYRRLGFECVDGTNLTPDEIVEFLALKIGG